MYRKLCRKVILGFMKITIQKILISIIAIFILGFISCSDSTTDKGDIKNSEKTTLTINNMSSYNLLSVEYASVNFGNISSGGNIQKEVSHGTRYVFFTLQVVDIQVRCRTSNVLTCEEKKNNEILFTNNTTITTTADDITNTLKNIIDLKTTEQNKSQILIKQNNTVIEQYGEFNFNTILIDTFEEINFIIENTGNSDLSIDTVNGQRINITENDSGFFYVSSQPLSSIIIPGNILTFTIRFNPKIVGNNFNAAVQIKTNSHVNNDFKFRLKGNCRIYQIGDTGTGGGMIFFAQGNQFKECSGELGKYTWNDAITMTTNYSGGGFSDWYLPNQSELDLMYSNLHERYLGGFSNSYDTGDADYWSSDENNNSSAWAKTFLLTTYYAGYWKTNPKTYTLRTRAVRSFTYN